MNTNGMVGWGPTLDTWDWKHPKWNGSNLAYWSQRVDAAVRYAATMPGPTEIPPPPSTPSLSRACLDRYSQSVYIGGINTFLRKWPRPSLFVQEFAGVGGYDTRDGGTIAVPPGVWYADPIDAKVSVAAAGRFVIHDCANGLVTHDPAIHRRSNFALSGPDGEFSGLVSKKPQGSGTVGAIDPNAVKQTVQGNPPKEEESSNTLLYIGLGLAAVVAALTLTKKG